MATTAVLRKYYTAATCPKRTYGHYPDCDNCRLICTSNPHEHIKHEAEKRLEKIGKQLCTCLTEYGDLGCNCEHCQTGVCTATHEQYEDCQEGYKYAL